jgi:hypothetical protein
LEKIIGIKKHAGKVRKSLFSQQKVNADISLRKYLVIHEILVFRMPRMSYLSSSRHVSTNHGFYEIFATKSYLLTFEFFLRGKSFQIISDGAK